VTAVRLLLHTDVAGRRVVVVGGGVAGLEKVRRLVAAGADVTVVDPSPSAEVAAEGVNLERRPFTPVDLQGAWLAVAATGDPTVDAAVGEAADAAGVWVNRADRADGGAVAFGAVVDRGPVQVGVTTGGVSPALARWVRDRIDAALPSAVGTLAELLARRPRTDGGRGHRDLPLDDALAALDAGEPDRAAALLGVEVLPHPCE
jgi:siroheme synthase-like protein